MNLAIDIGNTLQKIALFKNKKLIEFYPLEKISIEDLEQLYLLHPDIRASIISSVTNYDTHIRTFLEKKGSFIEFSETTSIPINNNYSTPETLGEDRLAAVVAANNLFPNNNCLVIQAGTCITFEFIDQHKTYLGGAISPGIDMRLKALDTFTGKLPLIERKENIDLIGTTTDSSILSGVMNGILEEVEGIITRYQNLYPGLMVVLSGGDMNYFDKRLKNNIFALPNIVLTGLNIILDYNFET